MLLINKFNKRIRCSLFVIDICSKHTWVVPLKDQKCSKITKTFQKTLEESGYKPNKIGVGKGSEFYSSSMKSWLKDYGIEMYSTHN